MLMRQAEPSAHKPRTDSDCREASGPGRARPGWLRHSSVTRTVTMTRDSVCLLPAVPAAGRGLMSYRAAIDLPVRSSCPAARVADGRRGGPSRMPSLRPRLVVAATPTQSGPGWFRGRQRRGGAAAAQLKLNSLASSSQVQTQVDTVTELVTVTLVTVTVTVTVLSSDLPPGAAGGDGARASAPISMHRIAPSPTGPPARWLTWTFSVMITADRVPASPTRRVSRRETRLKFLRLIAAIELWQVSS